MWDCEGGEIAEGEGEEKVGQQEEQQRGSQPHEEFHSSVDVLLFYDKINLYMFVSKKSEGEKEALKYKWL